MLTQWIALGVFVLLITDLVCLFVRKGVGIRSDAENKPPSDQGGWLTV
jgi:hypothetical protein